MSSAASEVIAEAPAADTTELEKLEPMLESDTDRHETYLQYDPSSKVPIPVVLVWICAFLGLGAYLITLYLPDLAAWSK